MNQPGFIYLTLSNTVIGSLRLKVYFQEHSISQMTEFSASKIDHPLGSTGVSTVYLVCVYL